MHILFLEKGKGKGLIVVIHGPMFSGKSSELIHQLDQATYMQLKVISFKPIIDDRYTNEKQIVSHNGKIIPCKTIDDADDILSLVNDEDVIGVDEGQFFGENLLGACQVLTSRGKIVFVAGLVRDYRDQGFGPMPAILMDADYDIAKIARCNRCGFVASRTQRISKESTQVVVGAKDKYEARCRKCYEPPADEPKKKAKLDVFTPQAA